MFIHLNNDRSPPFDFPFRVPFFTSSTDKKTCVHECVVWNAIDFENRLHLREHKSATRLTLIFDANKAELLPVGDFYLF